MLSDSRRDSLAQYYAAKMHSKESGLTVEDYQSFALYALCMKKKNQSVEHCIIDQVRKWTGRCNFNRKRYTSSGRGFTMRSRIVEHADEFETLDLSEAVREALARLSARDQKIWWLLALGYQKKEIAKAINRHPSLVSVRLRKTRRFLRDCLLMALG
jgi:DNA-directed RNA polymerase specialized sigma24 family protein